MEHSLQIKFSALFYLHSLVEIILSGTVWVAGGRWGSSQSRSEMKVRGEGRVVFPSVDQLMTAV